MSLAQLIRNASHTVVRILIADPHLMFREGLRKILETETDFEVVGEASDGTAALSLVNGLAPDILLLDIVLPKLSGLEVLQDLAEKPRTTAVVLLTDGIQSAQLLRALQLGARGLVMKRSPTAVLLKGIRQVMAGQYWIGSESSSTLMQALQRRSVEIREPSRGCYGLTRRELEVTAAIVAAFSNRDIAEQFSMSENTVKHHLANIFDKLGVSTRLELALFARHKGLSLPVVERHTAHAR